MILCISAPWICWWSPKSSLFFILLEWCQTMLFLVQVSVAEKKIMTHKRRTWICPWMPWSTMFSFCFSTITTRKNSTYKRTPQPVAWQCFSPTTAAAVAVDYVLHSPYYILLPVVQLFFFYHKQQTVYYHRTDSSPAGSRSTQGGDHSEERHRPETVCALHVCALRGYVDYVHQTRNW